MATKADFSAEQWQLLVDVPPLVGAAIMVAGRSGIGGSILEAIAMSRNSLKADEPYGSNELIKSLFVGRKKDSDRATVERMSSPYQGLTPDQMLSEAVRLCGELTALLSKTTSPQESKLFREWVYNVGVKIAEAAKEGDFMGIGGERVSESEEEALAAIAKALYLDV